MTPLRKALQNIQKGIQSLLQQTQEMEGMLDSIEAVLISEQPRGRGRGTRKAAAKKMSGKKAKKQTATDAVMKVILGSRNGASTTQIKKKTGLGQKQIYDIVNRMKRMGKIKGEKRGSYVKA